MTTTIDNPTKRSTRGETRHGLVRVGVDRYFDPWVEHTAARPVPGATDRPRPVD